MYSVQHISAGSLVLILLKLPGKYSLQLVVLAGRLLSSTLQGRLQRRNMADVTFYEVVC